MLTRELTHSYQFFHHSLQPLYNEQCTIDTCDPGIVSDSSIFDANDINEDGMIIASYSVFMLGGYITYDFDGVSLRLPFYSIHIKV